MDTPFLFFNDVKCTMTETNVEFEDIKNNATGETDYAIYSYEMQMMIVDPELGPDRIMSQE